MPLRNPCFLSYSRSEKYDELDRIVGAIQKVLSDQLKFYFKNTKTVFRDEDLKVGAVIDQALARELCESACMVMVFWPAYFDDLHTYCTREYKAMERIEKARLALLPAKQREHGLIIPLVIRRPQDLPAELAHRNHKNLEDYTLGYRKLENHPGFRKEMKLIADYIWERYRELTALGSDPCVDCPQTKFPSEDDVRDWLRQAVSWSSLFPLR